MSKGGYIGPGDVSLPDHACPVWLFADECLISFDDVKAGSIRCSRVGHPTATSDCARTDAQHH